MHPPAPVGRQRRPSSARTRVSVVSTGLLVAAACGGGPGPVDPDTVVPRLSVAVDSESIAFHHSPGDTVDAEWQEEYHRWATARLGVTLPGRLQYYKYANDGQMRSLTGRGCCFAEPERLAVHTVWPRDNHEVIHVYASRLGEPSNFFNEGLAVAFQADPVAGDLEPRWDGTHVHTLARDFADRGQVPPLRDIVETEDFRRLSQEVAYPVAGSFTVFLIREHGIESVRGLFRGGGGPAESRDHIEANFRAAFGRTLGDAEAAWRARLRAWESEG